MRSSCFPPDKVTYAPGPIRCLLVLPEGKKRSQLHKTMAGWHFLAFSRPPGWFRRGRGHPFPCSLEHQARNLVCISSRCRKLNRAFPKGGGTLWTIYRVNFHFPFCPSCLYSCFLGRPAWERDALFSGHLMGKEPLPAV